MQDFPPDYVAELHRQSAFVSAVLGGFAVAFLGALLAVAADRKIGTWSVGFATGAAVLFVVATFGSTAVVLDVVRSGITNFDYTTWAPGTVRTKGIADLTFFAGMYALLIGIGLSGWTRSRSTGIVTGVVASTGLFLLTVIISTTL